jgi:hypothetical protein
MPALLAGKLPDPVRVVAAIREQHRFGKQGAEESRTQPAIMRFTGRESEMNRQAIGVHHRMNLAGQAASRAAHVLMIVIRDAGPVLVHAHDGGINHLHRRVMTGGKRIHDVVADASLPPLNEAIVAGGARTIGRWQVAPWRI